jgi:hypothetical protein
LEISVCGNLHIPLFFKSVLVRSVSRRFRNTLLQHKLADDFHIYFLSTFFPLFFCKKLNINEYHFLENEEKRGEKENIEGSEKEAKKEKGKKRARVEYQQIYFLLFFLLSDDKVSVIFWFM